MLSWHRVRTQAHGRDDCTSRAATLNSPSFRRLKEGNRTMERSSPLIAGVGLADRARKSRWPARLDLTQSATGLVLVLFMWGHMFFVSSILISKDAMWTITKFFEGYFFFGTVVSLDRFDRGRGDHRH